MSACPLTLHGNVHPFTHAMVLFQGWICQPGWVLETSIRLPANTLRRNSITFLRAYTFQIAAHAVHIIIIMQLDCDGFGPIFAICSRPVYRFLGSYLIECRLWA